LLFLAWRPSPCSVELPRWCIFFWSRRLCFFFSSFLHCTTFPISWLSNDLITVIHGLLCRRREALQMKRYLELRHVESGAVSLSSDGGEVCLALGRAYHLDADYQVRAFSLGRNRRRNNKKILASPTHTSYPEAITATHDRPPSPQGSSDPSTRCNVRHRAPKEESSAMPTTMAAVAPPNAPTDLASKGTSL
jgi:hypothetical protein